MEKIILNQKLMNESKNLYYIICNLCLFNLGCCPTLNLNQLNFMKKYIVSYIGLPDMQYRDIPVFCALESEAESKAGFELKKLYGRKDFDIIGIYEQDGILLIAKEREEQINKNGFSIEKDFFCYNQLELRTAAMYCITLEKALYPFGWGNWLNEKVKSKRERMSDLEFRIEMNKIAGAFLAADIDLVHHILGTQENKD